VPERIERELREKRVIGRGHENEPLVDYVLLASTFLAVTVASLVVGARRNGLPRCIPLHDGVLLALAVARVSRLVTREKVARPIRAPFTDVAPGARPDEVKERPRGDGLVRSLGELLTCPRCFGVWASGAATVAYVAAPAATRTASLVLALALVNDLANLALARGQDRARKPA
jgi:hypothetical protein